jgi:hypothetical protein
MGRRIYIVESLDAGTEAAAATNNCPEITIGIPPRLQDTLLSVTLPYVYEEPDPPAPTWVDLGVGVSEKYAEEEYDTENKLVRRTVYTDETFTDKVKERLYFYSAGTLVEFAESIYNTAGAIDSTVITQVDVSGLPSGNALARNRT